MVLSLFINTIILLISVIKHIILPIKYSISLIKLIFYSIKIKKSLSKYYFIKGEINWMKKLMYGAG